jgi:hypothetical protein
MAVISVTTALMIATSIGVSNFFSGFFSGSSAGSACVPGRGVLGPLEAGEVESESGVMDHRGPFSWRK